MFLARPCGRAVEQLALRSLVLIKGQGGKYKNYYRV